jgi:hypothetical protein
MSLLLHVFFFYKSCHKCSVVLYFFDHCLFPFFPTAFCLDALLFFLSPFSGTQCILVLSYHLLSLHTVSSNCMSKHLSIYFIFLYFSSFSHFFFFFFFFFFSFFFFFFFFLLYTLCTTLFSALQLLRVTGSTVPIQFQSTTIHQSLHLFSC